MQSCYKLHFFLKKKLFYMFRVMKVHHQEVSCRTQTLWYNFISTCTWYCGDSSTYIIYRMG